MHEERRVKHNQKDRSCREHLIWVLRRAHMEGEHSQLWKKLNQAGSNQNEFTVWKKSLW